MLPTPMSVPDSEASHGQVSGRFREAMGRLWMTPKSGQCGMSAKTSGRPVEKSTHLSTQVAIAEGLLPTPQARDFRTGSGYRWEDKKKRSRNLNDRIAHDAGYAMFPTPRAGEGDRKTRYNQGGTPLGMATRFWRTPGASDGEGGPMEMGGGGKYKLRDQVLRSNREFWPTPKARNSTGAGIHGDGGMDLQTTVRMFPTATAADGHGHGYTRDRGRKGKERLTLAGTARMMPTPTVMDSAGFCGKPDKGRKGPNSGRTLTGKVLEGEGLGPHARMLPTATANDAKGSAYAKQPGGKGRRALKLTGAARLHPTPTNSMRTEADMAQAMFSGNSGKRPKYGDAKLVPTPTARDWRSDEGKKSDAEQYGTRGKPLPRTVGGQLNPSWVCALMGFPVGWTTIDFKAKAKVRKPKVSEIMAKATEASAIERFEEKEMEEWG